jgi:hypothetical protein
LQTQLADDKRVPDPRITELGFTVASECKLLGFNISQEPNRFENNMSELLKKVKKNNQLLENL